MIYLALLASYMAILSQSGDGPFPNEPSCDSNGNCEGNKVCEIPGLLSKCFDPCTDNAGCESRYGALGVPATCPVPGEGCIVSMCQTDNDCDGGDNYCLVGMPKVGDVCVECVNDVDKACADITKTCDTTRYECVECQENGDCSTNYSERPFCDTDENKCVGCRDDADCGGDSCIKYNCDNDGNCASKCAECTQDTDCISEPNLFCDTVNFVCDFNCQHINGTCGDNTCDLTVYGGCFDKHCEDNTDCADAEKGDYGLPQICDYSRVAETMAVVCAKQDCGNTPGYCTDVVYEMSGQPQVMCNKRDNGDYNCDNLQCVDDDDCMEYQMNGFDICGPNGYCLESCIGKSEPDTYCAKALRDSKYMCNEDATSRKGGKCMVKKCTGANDCTKTGYVCGDSGYCEPACATKQDCLALPEFMYSVDVFCQDDNMCGRNECNSTVTPDICVDDNLICDTQMESDTYEKCIPSCNDFGRDDYCRNIFWSLAGTGAIRYENSNYYTCNTGNGYCELNLPSCTDDSECAGVFGQDFHGEGRCDNTTDKCFGSDMCTNQGGDQGCFWHYFETFGAGATCDDETGNCEEDPSCDVTGCSWYVNIMESNGAGNIAYEIPCNEYTGRCEPANAPKTCETIDDCSTSDGYLCSLFKDPSLGIPLMGYCLKECTDDTGCAGLFCDDEDSDGVCDDTKDVMTCVTEDNNNNKGQCVFNDECRVATVSADCPDIGEYEQKCIEIPFMSNMCYVDCTATDSMTGDEICFDAYSSQYSNGGDEVKCNSESMFDVTVYFCDIEDITLVSKEPTSDPTMSPVEFCDADDTTEYCKGIASVCNKDKDDNNGDYQQQLLGDLTADDLDVTCAWCICNAAGGSAKEGLRECKYIAKKTLDTAELKKLWQNKPEFQDWFVKQCFPNSDCKFKNVEVVENPTDCDCEQFTCGDLVGGNESKGVVRYHVFGMIVAVLTMGLWM